MSKITKLQKIKDFIKENFSLEIEKIQLIESGVMNANYVVEIQNKEKYIFRVYNNKNKNDVESEVGILQYLSEKDFPSPKLVELDGGKLVYIFDGKPCIFYKYIEGKTGCILTADQLRQVGELLAKFHLLARDFEPRNVRKNVWDLDNLKKLVRNSREDVAKSSFSQSKELLDWVGEELKKFSFPSNLPQGITHQDVKPENIVTKKSNVKAFLDFDNTYYGDLLHDITTPIIWTCFKNEKLDNKLLSSYLDGYESVRKISKLEKEYFLEGLKFRLVREVFVGPYAASHFPQITKSRSEYFMKLYEEL